MPDWVAQRLWLGTISLAAALGARWLFRMLGTSARAGAHRGRARLHAHAVPARVHRADLGAAARVGRAAVARRPDHARGATRRLARPRAVRARRSSRSASVNAISLVFVGIGPALWLLLDALPRPRRVPRRAAAPARIAVLTARRVALVDRRASALQGTYGLPVLQLTETLRTVAADSDPVDILRGIGNWFFYGTDRLGFSIDQASSYVAQPSCVGRELAIPVVALRAAAIVRWRHRAYFVLLVIVGTVVGVGAWPYDDPSPYGRLFKWFAGDTAAGLALRVVVPRGDTVCMVALIACPEALWTLGKTAVIKKRTEN